MEKHGTKLKLPEHLCESDDPLTKAKAYSLQLLLIANQVGGKEMTRKLLEWLKNLDASKLNSLSLKYEKQHRRAEKQIPYIRCSLLKHLKGTTDSGYKTQIQKSEDVAVPQEVDGFLFEDLDDALQYADVKSDRFCEECKSSAISENPINFVSHSIESLVNLFGVVLKSFNSSRIAILGSQEGAIVYSAFLFSDATTIVSFEGDPKLREIQCSVGTKYGMKPRVHFRSLEEFVNTDLVNEFDVLIWETIGDCDSETLQGRINNFVASDKILVLKKVSEEDCHPFLKNLLQLKKHEDTMSCQEFILLKQ